MPWILSGSHTSMDIVASGFAGDVKDFTSWKLYYFGFIWQTVLVDLVTVDPVNRHMIRAQWPQGYNIPTLTPLNLTVSVAPD